MFSHLNSANALGGGGRGWGGCEPYFECSLISAALESDATASFPVSPGPIAQIQGCLDDDMSADS